MPRFIDLNVCVLNELRMFNTYHALFVCGATAEARSWQLHY